MKASKVKNTPYNPRKMSEASRKALRKSMDAFKDISGIVWNKTTGNLVSGNHRWDELVEEYGEDNLTLERLPEPSDDYMAIHGLGEFTGYLLREVNWDDDTEKAANIAANSEKLQGEFTNSVSNLLEEISERGNTLSDGLFDDLRFNELQMDFGEHKIDFDTSNEFDLDGFDDDFDEEELKIDNKNVLINDDKEEIIELAIIKVKCPLDKRAEITEKIKNALIADNDIEVM